MEQPFLFDVFLSHSTRDKPIVREIATQLRSDGIRVWFDEWEIKPGDNSLAKIDEGLERSRVLVLCMSENVLPSDWEGMEACTFRFRDPLNKERRFIPLKLDGVQPQGSISQFQCVDWSIAERGREYIKLLEACRRRAPKKRTPEKAVSVQIHHLPNIVKYGWHLSGGLSPNGIRIAYATSDNGIEVWDIEAEDQICTLQGHNNEVNAVSWSADQNRLLSASIDGTVKIWDLTSSHNIETLVANGVPFWCVSWSPDELKVAAGNENGEIYFWNIASGKSWHSPNIYGEWVRAIIWKSDGTRVCTGSDDAKMRILESTTGTHLREFKGHEAEIHQVAQSSDNHLVLTSSADRTLRLWDIEAGACIRVLEGHEDEVTSISLHKNSRLALSGSVDGTVRLWDIISGNCLRVIANHNGTIKGIEWSKDDFGAVVADYEGIIATYRFPSLINGLLIHGDPGKRPRGTPSQVQYTNAKVLIVGESGAGKTGISKRLAFNDWQPSDSTIGAWATQCKLDAPSAKGQQREVWLWDFGGQADQRLIHQLFMDDAELAVLVFDGQKEDVFETLGQWDRCLIRSAEKSLPKLLVAGRVDVGSLRQSRQQVESFAQERGFCSFVETSAKTGNGCDALKQAIFQEIRWEDIPWRTSPTIFKRLKEEIIQLKDQGRTLFRFNELRDCLSLKISEKYARFTDEQLKAVIGLLAGPGAVWELKFGSWILLQPERINTYAQAVIQTVSGDPQERGCIEEERVLRGELAYQPYMERLPEEEQRIVLLAMHQTLVERALCIREQTDTGTLLIFPSYYRRERPELMGHPAVHVTYRFNGFLDDIYATLVVRLHNTSVLHKDQLWRNAADFKTLTGKQLGIKMTRLGEGAGELAVYFDPTIPMEERIIFAKYVHEHIMKKAHDIQRLRHYVCQNCGTSVGNREVAMKRLEKWMTNMPLTFDVEKVPNILCVDCEQRVLLWDKMEQYFASPEALNRVRVLQEGSTTVLDNESKERVLVGEVISTVALAGQVSREFSISDHGIDMEIEFKNSKDQATGRKIYLQLKSGDSHTYKRVDGVEIFTIKDARHAIYWMNQAFPVFLVIRSSKGEIRCMDISLWLRQNYDESNPSSKHVPFSGIKFDVMCVRRWMEGV